MIYFRVNDDKIEKLCKSIGYSFMVDEDIIWLGSQNTELKIEE